MIRYSKWLSFLLAATLIATCTLPAARIPGGDAPHILAISERLASELTSGQLGVFMDHLMGLVTPHPPAGYLLPAGLAAIGMGAFVPVMTGLVSLAMCWHGMVLLRREDTRPLPLFGGLLLVASGMTWSMIDNMTWDLLAAGVTLVCLGHLHASNALQCKMHSAVAGAAAALGCLTKFTIPVFLAVPACVVLWRAVSNRHFKGLAAATLAFILIGGPWLSEHLGQVLAYVGSSTDPGRTISDSPAAAWASRLEWENLSYTPRVLKDALGWPGLALLTVGLGGLAHPGARTAAGAALGGMLVLTFAGERQARYLFPAIPLLCLLVDASLSAAMGRATRKWAHLAVASIALPMLWCSAATSWVYTDPGAVRDQTPQPMSSWGQWPWPATAFLPTSVATKSWRVQEALDALASAAQDEDVVGISIPRSPALPGGSTYAWQAARIGHTWDWATVSRGPDGRPMIFLGPFPAEGSPRSFQFAYIVRRPDQASPIDALPSSQLFHQQLPDGYTGEVIQIDPEAWDTPAAQRLLKDPMGH